MLKPSKFEKSTGKTEKKEIKRHGIKNQNRLNWISKIYKMGKNRKDKNMENKKNKVDRRGSHANLFCLAHLGADVVETCHMQML